MQIVCFGNEASVVWPSANRATFYKYQSHSTVVVSLAALWHSNVFVFFFASQRQIECKPMTDVWPHAVKAVRFAIGTTSQCVAFSAPLPRPN